MKLNKSTLKRLIKEEIQKSKPNLKEVDDEQIAAAVTAVMANAKAANPPVDLKKLDKKDNGDFEEEVEALIPDSDVSNNDDAKEEVINIIRNKLGQQVSLESKRLTKESLKAFVRDVIQEVTHEYTPAFEAELERLKNS